MGRTDEVFDLSSSIPLPSPADCSRCILMSTHPHGLSEPELSAWPGGGKGGICGEGREGGAGAEGGEDEATEAPDG